MRMYDYSSPSCSNEELALLIQEGDPQAASLLLSQNEGYLTKLATTYAKQLSQLSVTEDLKQEGALALLEAAQRFDPSRGTKLLTYATSAIEASMQDFAARNSCSLSFPAERYQQLRQVAFLCAAHEEKSEDELLSAIQKKLSVSAQVAKRLLEEYRTFFHTESLGDRVFDVSYGGDPAKAYDRFMRRTLLFQRMEEILNPRELNLVRSYLGLDQPDGRGMTFQELAIRLNYNGPSGAEKAYKSAIRKLKQQLNGGSYGQWIAMQKAIRKAVREVGQEPGYHSPQSVWWEQRHMAQ